MLHLFDHKYSKNSYSVDQYYNLKLHSVSHDPSEIILIFWLAAQETFLIINAENSCVTQYYCVFSVQNNAKKL